MMSPMYSSGTITSTCITGSNSTGLASAAPGLEGNVDRQLSGFVQANIADTLRESQRFLDGMLDVVVSEIDPPRTDTDWQAAVRERILSARQALLRHPWASRVMESRTQPTPIVLAYMDSMIELLLAGGFSIELVHHAMHAMGSRIMGFSQELFNDQSDADPVMEAEMWTALAGTYPSIFRLYTAISHDNASVVGIGCDDQLEFEFALDLLLNGLQHLRDRGAHGR